MAYLAFWKHAWFPSEVVARIRLTGKQTVINVLLYYQQSFSYIEYSSLPDYLKSRRELEISVWVRRGEEEVKAESEDENTQFYFIAFSESPAELEKQKIVVKNFEKKKQRPNNNLTPLPSKAARWLG